MITLKVEDMHCQNCVKRITNLLTEEGIQFEIDLDNRTVDVEDGRVDEAIDCLDDLGFEALKQ